jgi:3-methyl-2-oxobutanoate hydroxymethyltransferase
MLGFDESFTPKYLKRYVNLKRIIKEAVKEFKEEVSKGIYPSEDYTYHN